MKDSYFLIVTALYPPEPVVSAKLSFDIANYMSFENKVIVFSPPPSRPSGFEFSNKNKSTDNGIIHYVANSYICPESRIFGRLRESISFGIQTYKYLINDSSNIACVYANTWPLFSQFFLILAAKKREIPVFIHVQDIYPESLTNKLPFGKWFVNSLLKPIDKYVLKNAKGIIAITEKMKIYLHQTREIELKKISVVANWQNEEQFIEFHESQEERSKQNIFTFMYLGNIGPVAGLDVVIDAFVEANLGNCRLVIAGSGSYKSVLINKCQEKFNNKIEFWDVPEGLVPKIQNEADVMLLPIKKGAAKSSIPSKLPAYMFSQKPIIASVDTDSDTAESILKSNSGWLIQPENKEELIHKFKEVSKYDQLELSKIGMNGYNFAMKNFSKHFNLRNLCQVFNEC